MPHILALCGSLRQRSTNKTLLEAAARLAPSGMTLSLYEGLGQLPHFNPDLVPDPLIAPSPGSGEPMEVTHFRTLVKEADGLIISSPEYAHGVPGSLKNALDWLVSGSEIVGKPVALFAASTRSSFAQDSLREILKTMSVRLVEEAGLNVPLLGKKSTVEEIVSHPETASRIRKALEAFSVVSLFRES